MYVRVQRVNHGSLVYEYVHIVEGYRDQQGKVRHRVVAKLGRRDQLKASGALDNLAAAFTRLDPLPGRFLSGALPLVVPLLAALDLVGIVDRACPMRGRSRLTNGEVIAALVANRLTAPRPLYDVQGWAQAYAAGAWLGTPGELLNDDRLGRGLDAVSEHLDEIVGALGLQAIGRYGVEAARLHWDFTSVAFCGEYAEQDVGAPQIGYGHSSDRRDHCRQLKVAQAVTASGVPLYHRVVSGSRHEGAETFTLLERLRSIASPQRLLLVADAALVTVPNLFAAHDADMHFLARLPRTFNYEDAALAVADAEYRVLDYCSQRAQRLPESQRPVYRGAAGSIEIGDHHRRMNFRVLYVRGSEEAAAARTSRTKLMAGAELVLARIARGLQRRPKEDPEAIARRVAKAVAAGRVGACLRTELITTDGHTQLRWWRDEAALAEAERRDGLHALITNLPLDQTSADRLLALYKDQAVVERAHHFLKGPLLVRPVFLHSNRRAAALIAVCSIAVMVYGLIEAEVRREIAPRRTIPALLPEGRAARPTGPNIFAAFRGFGFQRARTNTGLEQLPDPLTTAQQAILAALGVTAVVPG